MPKHAVYVLDPYHPDAIALLQRTSSVNVVLSDDDRRKRWHADADALMLRSETKITDEDLSTAKKLKVIVKQGVGVDNIDLKTLNSEAVAELTLGLALCVARRVTEIDRRIRNGEAIVRSQALGQSLFQKTIGIIGMGHIGKETARKWRGAMDGKIVSFDPFAPLDAWEDVPHHRAKSLNEALETSDIVSLHVPLTSSTKDMIGESEFQRMKSNAILLNCARGGVVNEDALCAALSNKGIFGAALDAMDVEPPTLDAYGDLLRNENVIVTPHIGASTRENQSKSGIAVVEILLAVLEGKEVPNRLV